MWYRFYSNNVGFLLILVLTSSCELIQMKRQQQADQSRIVVARVQNTYLYKDDLDNLVSAGISKDDSTSRVEAYIDNWTRKQLIIHDALRKINIDEAEVERKILDYRYSLIGYEYQTYYVKKNLNTEVSEEEINTYYQHNIDNFLLKQNIVQGTYIKVSRSAPRTEKIKGMILSKNENEKRDLKSYCLSFSTAYHLGDSAWVVFDEMVKNSPLAEIPNKIQFLRTNPYYETSDNEFLYFLKIDAYRISDDVSPLEFVKDDIKNIILNKRKVELAKRLEEEVYENAVRNKDFEIYRN
ncbi:MAG TPA: peptidyl-prolyl cis-trans isomerase [Cyclobacteriaceae bacterium]|nr:peptidyl-prolyl cis-trans isomerase [Cyclobacteriaceae bacterium]